MNLFMEMKQKYGEEGSRAEKKICIAKAVPEETLSETVSGSKAEQKAKDAAITSAQKFTEKAKDAVK